MQLSKRDRIEIRVFGLVACAVGVVLLAIAVALFVGRYENEPPEIVAKVRADIEDETTGRLSQDVSATLVLVMWLGGLGMISLTIGTYMTRFSLLEHQSANEDLG